MHRTADGTLENGGTAYESLRLMGRAALGELPRAVPPSFRVASASVRDLRVFLFDEPLSNLDAELLVEITKLHRRLGNTMIYVTHDQTER